MELDKDNMVNMKWPEIREAAEKKSIALLPLGVIKEHGPHLCVGTDIYTAQVICSRVKEELRIFGLESVIAPPFFWGICQSTRDFIGSFKIRMETAQNLVFDILNSLNDFGFKETYGINAHGDIEQNILFMNSFKDAYEKIGMLARYCFHEPVMHFYGLKGDEGYICPIPKQEVRSSEAKENDMHGGDVETAIIHKYYPRLADIEMAKLLPAVALEKEQEMEWLLGGKTKELSENGYVGNPSKYDEVRIEEHIDDLTRRYADAILLKRKA